MGEGSLQAWFRQRRKPRAHRHGNLGSHSRRKSAVRRRLGATAAVGERMRMADRYGVMMVNGGVALFIAALIASNRLALWAALHRLFAG